MAEIFKSETALGVIEQRMSGAIPETDSVVTKFSIPATANTAVLKGLVSKSEKTVQKSKSSVTGISKIIRYSRTGDEDVFSMSGSELQATWAQYWTGIWATFGDFVSAVLVAQKEWQNVKTEKDVGSASTISDLYAMLSQKRGGEEKPVWLRFGSTLRSTLYEPSETDKDFVLSHLYRDSDASEANIYWKFSDTLLPVPVRMVNGDMVVQNTGKFWSKFLDENQQKVYDYLEAVLSYLTQAVNGGIDTSVEESETVPENFERNARLICPDCLLRAVAVGLIMSGGGKDKKAKVSRVTLKYQVGKDRLDQMMPQDLRKALCKTLLDGVKPESIPIAPVFSNAAGVGLSWLGSLPIAKKHDVAPSLEEASPTWWKFLHGKFPSEEMGLVRLAYFVTSLFDSHNFARQYLYCVGSGLDGKSIMLSALSRMLRDDRSLEHSLGADDFMQNNFALQNAINKRIIIIDDVGTQEIRELLVHDKLKRLTGAGGTGTVFVDVKGTEAIAWRVSGAKLVIATNFGTTLEDEATITRMNPLCFRKNYTPKTAADPRVLEDALVIEKAPFVQWSFDMVEFYKTVENVKGEKAKLFSGSGVAVFTDEQWNQWKSGELDIFSTSDGDDSGKLARSLRREAFQSETTVPNRPSPFILIQDTDDDDAEAWDSVARALLVRDDTATSTSVEIREAIIWCTQMPVGTPQRFLVSKVGLDKSTSVQSLGRTTAYSRFLEAVYRVFGIRMSNIKQTKALKGLRVVKDGMGVGSVGSVGSETYSGGSDEFLE